MAGGLSVIIYVNRTKVLVIWRMFHRDAAGDGVR